MKKFSFFVFIFLVGLNFSDGIRDRSRKERLFSLFNVITFKNGLCTTTDSTASSGTCYTNSECVSKGGSPSGTCASGFGVCCLFLKKGCAVTVSHNCTYIQNTAYPNTKTDAETCKMSFDAIDNDICQIRLDFVEFSTAIASSGTCTDSFQVSSPYSSSTLAFPTSVCGDLKNQHMYIETGRASTSPIASATLTTVGTSNSRKYRIKATYYLCSDSYKAPEGCTQYFTGNSGTITSYNFPGSKQIKSRRDRICVRQESGFCAMQLFESSDVTDAFDLGPPTSISATSGTNCNPHGALEIAASGTATIFCGGILADATAITDPASIIVMSGVFQFSYMTGTNSLSGFAGYSLDYFQLPCSSA